MRSGGQAERKNKMDGIRTSDRAASGGRKAREAVLFLSLKWVTRARREVLGRDEVESG